LARRAGYRETFKKSYPATPILFVDAGDFTGDPGVPGQRQTDALITAMGVLGYQVANVSQRELQHGYDVFMERRARGNSVAFISANVVWQDTGAPVVDPTAVR